MENTEFVKNKTYFTGNVTFNKLFLKCACFRTSINQTCLMITNDYPLNVVQKN